MEQPRCECCGKHLSGRSSLDVWVLRTIFDWNGEVRKSNEQPEGWVNDYLVIGEECCGGKLRKLWEELFHTMTEHARNKDINQEN